MVREAYVTKFILFPVVLLAACAPKMTDAPDLQKTVAKPWKELADCSYAALIEPGVFGAGAVDYSPIDSQRRAIITVDNGRSLKMEVRGEGDASTVTMWAHATFPGITSHEQTAWAAVASCT